MWISHYFSIFLPSAALRMVFKISAETCLSNLQLHADDVQVTTAVSIIGLIFLYCQVIKQDVVFCVLCNSCGWPSVPSKGFGKTLCWLKIVTFLFVHIKLLLWCIAVHKELMFVVINWLEFHMDHTHQIPVLNIFWNLS